MTTMRQMGNRAARLATIHGGAGRRVMPPEMFADTLESNIGMYKGFIGNGLFGPTINVDIAADYEAGENERIRVGIGLTVDITLPDTVTDAETGLARAPEDRSFVIITGASPAFYVYDADYADWIELSTLTLDSYAPFSARFETGLASLLAVHMISEYGMEPSAILASMASTAHGAMRLKKPRVVYAQTPLLRGVGRSLL